jgi:leucine-rich PPR motif-containing protein
MEGSTYTRILSVCREMFEKGLTIDLRIAIHWLKWLHKIERMGGALTEALQRIYPPDWNSSENLEALNFVSDGDSDFLSLAVIQTLVIMKGIMTLMTCDIIS